MLELNGAIHRLPGPVEPEEGQRVVLYAMWPDGVVTAVQDPGPPGGEVVDRPGPPTPPGPPTSG